MTELLHGGVSHPVPPDGGSLGSGEGAWVRLPGTGVLPDHARIRVEPAGVVIVPSVPEATIAVNGTPVGPGGHALAEGDRISIGPETLTVKDRATLPPGAAQQLADTLAGVPSFRPPTPPRGSLREAGESPRGSMAGPPRSGSRKVVWGVLAVVLLGVVLYMLLGR